MSYDAQGIYRNIEHFTESSKKKCYPKIPNDLPEDAYGEICNDLPPSFKDNGLTNCSFDKLNRNIYFESTKEACDMAIEKKLEGTDWSHKPFATKKIHSTEDTSKKDPLKSYCLDGYGGLCYDKEGKGYTRVDCTGWGKNKSIQNDSSKFGFGLNKEFTDKFKLSTGNKCPKVPKGFSCRNGDECQSGNCLNGVCCKKEKLLSGNKCSFNSECINNNCVHKDQYLNYCTDERECVKGAKCIDNGCYKKSVEKYCKNISGSDKFFQLFKKFAFGYFKNCNKCNHIAKNKYRGHCNHCITNSKWNKKWKCVKSNKINLKVKKIYDLFGISNSYGPKYLMAPFKIKILKKEGSSYLVYSDSTKEKYNLMSFKLKNFLQQKNFYVHLLIPSKLNNVKVKSFDSIVEEETENLVSITEFINQIIESKIINIIVKLMQNNIQPYEENKIKKLLNRNEINILSKSKYLNRELAGKHLSDIFLINTINKTDNLYNALDIELLMPEKL